MRNGVSNEVNVETVKADTIPTDTPKSIAPPLMKSSMRVIYSFAGERRKNDIGSKLKYYTNLRNMRLELRGVDLLIHSRQDGIRNEKVWNTIITDIKAGKYDIIVASQKSGQTCRVHYQIALGNTRGGILGLLGKAKRPSTKRTPW